MCIRDRANITIGANELKLEADGFVSAVQFTITHDSDFVIELTNELNSDYGFGACNQADKVTTCIIVGPESSTLFNSSSAFEVEDMIVGNSNGYVEVLYDSVLPGGYAVSDAYPNPFNPSTSLTIDLDQESFVSVKAYNVLGQLAAEVFEGNLNGYGNKIVWNAVSATSGVYFMQVQVGNDVSTKKVMLLK